MYKQLIIVREDLRMLPVKLAAQVSHASMAFLIAKIKENAHSIDNLVYKLGGSSSIDRIYQVNFTFDGPLYEEWISGSFIKVICGARNKSKLMKAVKMAQKLGMREGEDYFLIRDNCLTELDPEDEDDRTLTCIGFKPMESGIIEKISKKY